MLRFDKMTVKAQEALQESQEIAARHEQQEIAPLHCLSGAGGTDGWRRALAACALGGPHETLCK